MNNKLKDQRFLRDCFRGDKKALDLWIVLSYWSEVVDAVKAVASKYTVGQVDIQIVRALVVVCTSELYQQWGSIPSLRFDLKTQVRKYAINFMLKYVQAGGKLKSTP